MRSQNIGCSIERFGSIRITVLNCNYRNAGIFLLNSFLKTLLALVSRDRPSLHAKYGDSSLSTEFVGEPLGGHHTTLSVVGGNIREIGLGADARIENGNRDSLFLRAFDDWNKRVTVRRGQHNAVHSPIDRVLDNVDLTA